MKKVLQVMVFCAVFALGALTAVNAQQPQGGMTDTVNMDTEAVPTFYYDIEDGEAGGSAGKSSTGTIAIIIGAVVVVGAVAFFLLKKKK
ncbi:MAG: LPXTG cell wall anchor domain-containing protein [Bacteroidetes bacterium]|jgi:LPXTG-motif cell wall-anchored protein|nr:LPXTG cell wall anchor domain-containing protein [Bacteroidota bacterium]